MLAQLVVSSVVMLVLDAIFLYANSNLFMKQVFDVQRSPLKVNYVGAALTYVLMIFGVNYFILFPKKSVLDAFLLGGVINGVYEGTSYAVLKNWRPATVMVDTLWGGVLMAATTFLTRAMLKKIN
jgi:uncharacterized membrane protein